MDDVVEEVIPVNGPRPAAAAPARRRGAARRARVRARGVPAVLGRAVAELARARPRDRRSRAAAARGRSSSGCGLGLPSIAAALAGGRVLATDWSQRGDRDDGDQRRAQRRNARDARVHAGPSPGRCSSARRGTWCSPPTCSTRRATAKRCSTLLPRLGRDSLARRPRPQGRRAVPRRGARDLGRRAAARAGARQRRRVPVSSAGGDVERARAQAAAAAEAMTDGAVEEQRVALVQCVDRAVEIDFDGAAYYIDEDLAGRSVALFGPRPRTARPLADAQRGAVGEQLRGRRPAPAGRCAGTSRRRRRGARARAPGAVRSTACSPRRRARGRSARPTSRSAARARARAG